MFILIVDDAQSRHERFKDIFAGVSDVNGSPVVMSAFTMDEAKDLMSRHTFNMLCLDHDLGHKTKDGRAFCRWVVSTTAKPEKVLIHSRNSVANREMANILLDKYGRSCNVRIMPFEA